MRNRNPLLVLAAALVVALAGWLGFDIGTAQRDDALAPPPAPAPRAASSSPAPAAARPVPEGDFDYYLLALSWSPSYCEAEATARDRLQCGGRPYHFIVHGLWPQNERGYPESCPTDTPRVPDALVDEMLDIMPSRGLVGHQWRTHGACTGHSQEAYFAEIRAAWERIVIPARFEQLDAPLFLAPGDIVQDFIRANPMLRPAQITVTCSRQSLAEVRICMTKDLQFTDCGAQSRRSACRQERVRMPPVRAGR